MPRIQAIEPEQAKGEAQQLLAAVNDKFGMVPNLARALGEAIEGSLLPAKLREQIALTRKPTAAATAWPLIVPLSKQPAQVTTS